jgi:hypothetical protein
MPETDFTLTPAPAAWPLIFKHRGPVLGRGFVAVIELHGRILARQEPNGEVSIEGVHPGGFAVSPHNIRAASLELQKALTGILVDIAEEADSFEAFKAAVEEFFWQTDDESVAEWDACVQAVRRGQLSAPYLLPVLAANLPLMVTVTRKPEGAVTPQDNSTPEPVLAAVA